MGVYIKGMEKRSCGDCPLVQYHATSTGFQSICYVTHKLIEDIDVTKDCPMVEVPEPHGRLIDADMLMRDEIRHLHYHLPNGDESVPIIDIKNAKTVIEAEKE